MSIEQSLSQAPLGLNSLEMDDSPMMEIEIVNPEGVKIDMDGVEIDLMPEENEEGFDDNLAEYIDEGELQSIASDLIEMVDAVGTTSLFDKNMQVRVEWIPSCVSPPCHYTFRLYLSLLSLKYFLGTLFALS